jgi:ribosome-associated toxin RatA of RatAB toxin-antitoxin module
MQSVKKTATLNIPAAKVWDAIKDFDSIERFHPMVKSSPIIGSKKQGVGAQRHCNFYDGSKVTERITSWQEGRGYSIEVSEITLMPVKEMHGRMRVDPISNGQSEMSFELLFTPKYGPVGWLMAQVMMKPMMRGILKKVVIGLEDHITTGNIVGENGVLTPA